MVKFYLSVLLLFDLDEDSLLLVDDLPLLALVIKHDSLWLKLHLFLLLGCIQGGARGEILNHSHLSLLLLLPVPLLLGHFEFLLLVSSFSLLLGVGGSLLQQGRGRGSQLARAKVHHLDKAVVIFLGWRFYNLVILVESNNSGAAFTRSRRLINALFSISH